MPLYEYECTVCHRRTEKIQKFSDPELTECPFCGQRLERTLTAPAVHFSGGGWYKDLYSSAKPAAAGNGEGSPGQSGSGETKAGSSENAAPGAGSASGESSSGSGNSTGSSAPPAPSQAAPAAASTPKSGA